MITHLIFVFTQKREYFWLLFNEDIDDPIPRIPPGFVIDPWLFTYYATPAI